MGAGPGDPELITMKAIRALAKADAILYDALANEALLQYASGKCHKEYVGKRYGCHALSQQEINQRIVELSFNHNRIIRLKGGDPFVFGRAQEEIDWARQHGFHVEVIPGISSALAVPAAQMIPLTARGINESFWVTTGTTQSGKVSEDLKLAAQSSATVVILMAMSKLEEIMEIFSSYGKENTPVAIIQEGTTPNEKMVIGSVMDIVFKVQNSGLTNPSIIIVREVVKLHPSFMKEIAVRSRENMFIKRDSL
ncbi:MAG TPA: uroporphyrinogen-III C-methyltransferase [Flavisolibacter sp.]|nr:uroporphyrinogen-III C-methyltransferase [Flavisolibacter sp.]